MDQKQQRRFDNGVVIYGGGVGCATRKETERPNQSHPSRSARPSVSNAIAAARALSMGSILRVGNISV